jgi:alanine racemase
MSQNAPARSSATLTIDLDAVAANYRRLRTEAPGAEIAPVVKTDAYGLGAIPVARQLAAEGAKTFFVAHPGEGIALRGAGLAGANLYVLESLGGEAPALLADHDLMPALATLSDVEAWAAEAKRRGRQLPCALHIDTGMNRLGLSSADAERLAAAPGALDGLDIRLVMSHLACADEPHSPMNEAQRVRFDNARSNFPNTLASLANSSGVFLDPAYRYDLVRPGMALYGLNPIRGHPNPMKPVVALAASILQIRQIDKGESVGYGASYRAGGRITVATVGVGYGDGFARALGNRGWGYLRGCRVPIIGRISMDFVSLDVSGVGPEPARVGESVELIGPNVTADEVGVAAGSLGYEILTNLGQRYVRRYLGAAKGD